MSCFSRHWSDRAIQHGTARNQSCDRGQGSVWTEQSAWKKNSNEIALKNKESKRLLEALPLLLLWLLLMMWDSMLEHLLCLMSSPKWVRQIGYSFSVLGLRPFHLNWYHDGLIVSFYMLYKTCHTIIFIYVIISDKMTPVIMKLHWIIFFSMNPLICVSA